MPITRLQYTADAADAASCTCADGAPCPACLAWWRVYTNTLTAAAALRGGAEMSARRLPPYGKEIRHRLRSGIGWWGTSPDGARHAINILVGADCWTYAEAWRGTRLLVALPPGEDPERFNWRCLSGADPLLLWRCGRIDGDTLLALLRSVMRDGVDHVLDVMVGVRYIAKEVRHAA